MDSIEYIKRKYQELIPRSFETRLEIFLFHRCITHRRIDDFSIQDFHNFRLEEEIVNNYELALKLGAEESLHEGSITMQEVDSLMENWLKTNQKKRIKLLEGYTDNFKKDYFPFEDFLKKYSRDPKERICHYCKITDEDIQKMRKNRLINTKRLRGYSMEVDRIKPNYEYTFDNIVLACYWCNNAKTDEFSEKEFIDHIGPGIKTVWNERILKNYKSCS